MTSLLVVLLEMLTKDEIQSHRVPFKDHTPEGLTKKKGCYSTKLSQVLHDNTL